MKVAILSVAAVLFLTTAAWSVRVAAAAPQARASAAAARTPDTVYADVCNGWKWWHVYCFRCAGGMPWRRPTPRTSATRASR